MLYRINRGIEAMKIKQVLICFGVLTLVTGCGEWDTRPSPFSSAGLKEGLVVSATVMAGQALYNAANSSLDALEENRRQERQRQLAKEAREELEAGLAAADGGGKLEPRLEIDRRWAQRPVGCLTGGEVSYQSKSTCLEQGGELSSEMVAECKYPDGGVQLIMLDDCQRFLSAEVIAVYDASTKPEILVDSQIVRKLNN